MNTAELGKVKKRYIFRPIKSKANKLLDKNKKRILNIKIQKSTFFIFIVTLLIVTLGSNLFISRLKYTFRDLYIFANPTPQSLSLNIDNNIGIKNANGDNSNSQVLGLITNKQVESNAIVMDKRSYIFDQYFLKNNSPLYGTGKLFVEACDKYGAPKDCITAIAIARNETDLCKYNVSAQMHNCWGFGGAGINRINFSSFEQSIDRVTKTLVYSYGKQYIIDPSLMERTFCGPDPSCIGWGAKVKVFINQIDKFSQDSGLGSLLELR